MVKTAIVVLAGTDTHADLGRVTNALTAAKEFADAGDELEIIFDGAGTSWIPELESPDNPNNALYRSLTDHISVCDYCANAFGVDEDVEAAPVSIEDGFEGHPSVRELVADGYEVITY